MFMKKHIYCLSCAIKIVTIFLMFNSCSGGGHCRYNNVDAYFIIDSIGFEERNFFPYRVYCTLFKKFDNKPLQNVNGYISENWITSILDTNCLSSNRIKVGDTIFVMVDTIIFGTCDPISFKITDDDKECISNDWINHWWK